MFFLLFLLDDRLIRIHIFDEWIREVQKHMYPTASSISLTTYVSSTEFFQS
jgi:hypothetical protein